MEEGSKIILYTTPDGKSRVSLMSRDGRVWLNQKQMAELFAVSKMNISLHVSNILKEKELDDSVVKCYFTTAAIFLETAELRVKRKMDLTLPFWQATVDGMLRSNLYEVLSGPGRVSHEKAVEVSNERYDAFDERRKQEEARLADEADMAELRRIEEEAKRRG